MIPKRRLFPIFFFCFTGAAAWVAYSTFIYEDEIEEQVNLQEVAKATPEITAEDISLKLALPENGQSCHIHSEKAHYFQDYDTIDCEETTCTVMQESKPLGTITATQAHINSLTKYMEMTKGVHGESGDLTFDCDRVSYDMAHNLLTTEAAAHVAGPELSIDAGHGTVDIKAQTVNLSGGVRCEFRGVLGPPQQP